MQFILPVRDRENHCPAKNYRVTDSVLDALELEDVKSELLVDHELDDSQLQRLITMSTKYCESYTNRALITQTRGVIYHRFPNAYDSLALGYGPIQSVDEITYITEDNEQKIVDEETYFLIDEDDTGYVVLFDAQIWPYEVLRRREAIEIQYTCGYGDTPEDIPPELTEAMMNLIKWHYHDDSEGDVPNSVTSYLDHFKL